MTILCEKVKEIIKESLLNSLASQLTINELAGHYDKNMTDQTENKSKDEFDAVREVVESVKPFHEDVRKRIIKWACEALGINSSSIVGSNNNSIKESCKEDVGVVTPTFSKPKDLKSFVESKNPSTDKHFAAVVAYYYQFEARESERKDSITKEDLVNATRLANWERLSRPDQTLVNAANSGILDRGATGHYVLNSVGENLVAMVLPNGESVKKAKSKKATSKPKNQKKAKK